MCRTVYETECWTKHNVHEVEDEVAVCETVEEKKCEDVVSGYTSSLQCSSFPREKCRLEKRKTKKVSPETGCDKEPVELCAPRGCGFVNVRYFSFSDPIVLTGLTGCLIMSKLFISNLKSIFTFVILC